MERLSALLTYTSTWLAETFSGIGNLVSSPPLSREAYFPEVDAIINQLYGCKTFHCDDCSEAFVFPTSLDYHIRNKHPSKPLRCESCRQEFPASDMGLVLDTDPTYSCPFCKRHVLREVNYYMYIVDTFERMFTTDPRFTASDLSKWIDKNPELANALEAHMFIAQGESSKRRRK